MNKESAFQLNRAIYHCRQRSPLQRPAAVGSVIFLLAGGVDIPAVVRQEVKSEKRKAKVKGEMM